MCHGSKKVSKVIAKAVWIVQFVNGYLRDNLRFLAIEEIKQMFLLRNVLKKKDALSGALNFSSLELLHKIENEFGKRHCRGIVPSCKMM